MEGHGIGGGSKNTGVNGVNLGLLGDIDDTVDVKVCADRALVDSNLRASGLIGIGR